MRLVWLYASEQADLRGLRIACMCLLCCAGFLRYSELAILKRNNICFCDNYVKLFLENSKTDVYREGREVLISKTNSPTCPFVMLQRYLTLANIDDTSVEYIFRPLCYCKSRNTYILRQGRLSYTTARETLLSALNTLGLQKKMFGLHSLMSAGATAAAAAGFEDRLFKKHGRWKTDRAKDGYAKENIVERLSVTKQLSI